MTLPKGIMDITVVGGGPTGLFAAFYSGLRGLKTKIVDSLPHLGGQLSALYPEKHIYDVPGFPVVTAKELVSRLQEQAFRFPISLHLEETVQHLRRRENGVLLLTTDRDVHSSKAVIVAVGMGAFKPKKLDIENLEQYEGKGVHYFVPRLSDFHGKRVLIVGGGDSAVDWALALNEHAEVTLVHRRGSFRAHEHSVEQLLNSKANVRTFHELVNIAGGDHVETVTIVENRTKETQQLPVDEIILSLGFSPDLSLIEQWGLSFAEGGIRVSSKMETSVSGVYAAGDIASYPGKVKLIATAFGEAAVAANNAAHFVNPQSKLSPGHSSSRLT